MAEEETISWFAGVVPASAPSALIGIKPVGDVLSDEFVIERLRRSRRLIGSGAVIGELLAGLDERRPADAVDAFEPIGQGRNRGPHRRGDGHTLGIDCLVKTGDCRRHTFGKNL
jgi:hypothetical protein